MLCIIQDDTNDKLPQIPNMAPIYGMHTLPLLHLTARMRKAAYLASEAPFLGPVNHAIKN
jgi:hypothetical protein